MKRLRFGSIPADVRLKLSHGNNKLEVACEKKYLLIVEFIRSTVWKPKNWSTRA